MFSKHIRSAKISLEASLRSKYSVNRIEESHAGKSL